MAELGTSNFEFESRRTITEYEPGNNKTGRGKAQARMQNNNQSFLPSAPLIRMKITNSELRPRINWILQNIWELLRFMGLHMVQKSLHTADFGLHRTIFGLLMVCTF